MALCLHSSIEPRTDFVACSPSDAVKVKSVGVSVRNLRTLRSQGENEVQLNAMIPRASGMAFHAFVLGPNFSYYLMVRGFSF